VLKTANDIVAHDGSKGIALWRRVADDLERAIATGTYPGGARLPGEVEIASRLGVNRHTVRRALADLADRGFIRAARGSGTYVESARLAYPIGSRTRFSEIVGAAGHEVGGELIGDCEETADENISHRLGIKAGAPVVRLEILRSADGMPLCVATSWVSAARMPEAASIYRAKHSMTKTLAHFGIRDYRRRSTRVSAAPAEASDAARLGLVPGRLVLIVESLDVTRAGKPILTTHARFAADRVELVVES
jgi:GntR family phosphonate transport system transcriptional regulator